MIKTLLQSRCSPAPVKVNTFHPFPVDTIKMKHDQQPESPLFVVPEGCGASFEEVNYDAINCSNATMRTCFSCGEAKLIADFPMSMGKSRHCRFCITLGTKGLDVTTMSCAGDAAVMKEPAIPKKNKKEESENRRPTLKGLRRHSAPNGLTSSCLSSTAPGKTDSPLISKMKSLRRCSAPNVKCLATAMNVTNQQGAPNLISPMHAEFA